MNDMTFTINGARLRVRETGDGVPVVAVHGALCDLRVWEPLRPLIDGSARMIAYTQRYFGSEDWNDAGEDFGPETHAEDLIGLIEAMRLPPVHLLTWSYGGHVGLEATLRRPDLFAGATHFEPSINGLIEHSDAGKEATAIFRHFFTAVSRVLERHGAEAAAMAFVGALRETDPSAAQSPFDRMFRENARMLPPYLERQDAFRISPDRAARCAVPTTLITGTESSSRYRMIAAELARLSRAERRLELAGVNHAMPAEQPERLAPLVLSAARAVTEAAE